MLREDEVIMLEDNKEYYVLNSIMDNDKNFVLISEIIDDEISKKIKIMNYDIDNNKVKKVTDPSLLFNLVVKFLES